MQSLMPWSFATSNWKQVLLKMKHATLRVRTSGRAFHRNFQSAKGKTMQNLTRTLTSSERVQIALFKLFTVFSMHPPLVLH